MNKYVSRDHRKHFKNQNLDIKTFWKNYQINFPKQDFKRK